jgi:RNA polymerase sigma factor for flagellar operon FliA
MPKSQVRAASRQTQSRTPKRNPKSTAVALSPKRASSSVSRATKAAKPSRTATAPSRPAAAPSRAAGTPSRAAARPATAPSRRVPMPTRVIEVTAAPPAPAAQDALWKAYAAAKSRRDDARVEDLRNRLIERYYEVVRFTAERMHTRLPNEVDVNDLMSAGLFGLMDAIDAFDPGRGVKFETYCAPRIRGAIFDELRAMDWVPRLVRSRTAKVEKVRKEFELTHGRKPTDEEVSRRMNVSGAEYDKLQKDSRPVGIVSLDRKAFESDSSREVREVDVIEDDRQPNPMEIVQRGDLQTLITKGLSRAERLIVILYYYEEMTMKEIGLTLDLSESRVSQMHSSILARLKAQMQHRLKEF